jgi:hypothetical protein
VETMPVHVTDPCGPASSRSDNQMEGENRSPPFLVLISVLSVLSKLRPLFFLLIYHSYAGGGASRNTDVFLQAACV